MSGLLAVWNDPHRDVCWPQLLNDLQVLGTEGIGDWHDESAGVSLGRTQLFNTPESRLEAAVVHHQGCVLVWEGRIDDRSRLLAGRAQVSDAELIVEAYKRWGIGCVNRLVGEFAFVLWDEQQQQLFVAADPVGCRSLTYAWDGNTLLVSSRAMTLLQHPAVSSALNELYLIHILCYLNAHPPGITAFQSIRRLIPGEALCLSAGNLTTVKVGELLKPKHYAPEQYASERSQDEYYEAFWHLMDQAVQDRLRADEKVCVTLSGGLDSTTVSVSLLNHLSSLDAYSNITTLFPEFDERDPIKAFVSAYPQIQWHSLNADRAWSFTESWDSLPLPDDPFTAGTLAMDLHMMKRLQQSGYQTVFGGDWGDHLFFTGWQDIARARVWPLLIEHFRQSKSWKSTLWRDFLVPGAPEIVQRWWFKRLTKSRTPFPAWIRPALYQDSRVQHAFFQYFQERMVESMPEFVCGAIASTRSLGARQVYKLLNNFHGFETVSPFHDRRLIEFAFQLPPALQYHDRFNKIFLRRANEGKLPKEIQWRPKTNFFDPLAYVGLGELDALEATIKSVLDIDLVSSFIDEKRIFQFIADYKQSYQQGEAVLEKYPTSETFAVCNLVAFARWHVEVKRRIKKQ